MVRRRSAKPLYGGSNPPAASNKPDKTGRPQEWGLLIFGQGAVMGMRGFLAHGDPISFFAGRSSLLPRTEYAWHSFQLNTNEPSVEMWS